MNCKKPIIPFDDLSNEAWIQTRTFIEYQVVPYSATTIWRLEKSGEFPRAIKISSGITARNVGEIRKYLESLKKKSKGDAS